MRTVVFTLITCLLYLFLISGCSPSSRYERKMNHELKSGMRYDSLFMGLYLGMPRKDFYMHCWKLNRRGLIKQGSNNTTVEYYMKNELKHPAFMDFYPTFTDNKISEMPVRYAYAGWAPWNKELSSKNLQADVLRWYKKIYGGGFIKVTHPQKGTAFVKIDGNRRIVLFAKDDLYVWVIFTDLSTNMNPPDFDTDFHNNTDTLLNNSDLK